MTEKFWMIDSQYIDSAIAKLSDSKPSINALLGRWDMEYERRKSLDLSGNPLIALVEINGVMSRGGGWLMGNEDIAQILTMNDNDSEIKAHVLKINSPGGTVDSTKMLAETVASLKKPVVVFGNKICSAAYVVASAATHIMIENQSVSEVGSIGAMVTILDNSEYLASQGIKKQVIVSPGSPDKYREETVPLPDEILKSYEDELSAIRKEMIAFIKKNRAGSIMTEDVFTGKVYKTKEALVVGLVDSVGQLKDAIDLALRLAVL